MQFYIDETEEYILHTYNRYQVVFDHGDGVNLYDADGKEYLDFVSGIGVFALGYNNKMLNDAIKALKIPPYNRATADNPVNCTSLIINNGFEEGNLNGWTNEGTQNAQTQNNTSFDGKQGDYYCERWHVSGTIDINQTVKELPAGLYSLSAYVYSSATDAKLYVNSDSVEVSDSQLYTVWVVIEESADPEEAVDSLKFGVKWSDSGDKWTCLDEFTLQYYGVEAATNVQEYAEEVKQAAEIVEIYNVAGVAQPSLQPGVNIVKYANGDVKKIQVKK